MVVVYNKPFGGWHIPKEVAQKLNIDEWDNTKEDRTRPELIMYVLTHPYGDLSLAEVPDDATDWAVWDYDGAKTVFYVQNGKIKYCN